MEIQQECFSKEVIKLIDDIGTKITNLNHKIQEQEQIIDSLTESKKMVDKKYEMLHAKIKEYLQELEEIRKYVDSNNKCSEQKI